MGLSPLQRLNRVDQFANQANQVYSQRTPSNFLNDFVRRNPAQGLDTLQSVGNTLNKFQNDFTSGGFADNPLNAYQNSFTQQQPSYSTGFEGAMGQAGGQVTNVGGAWAALDQHNNEYAMAAQQFGAPANLLKAMVNRESSGNWARDNRIAVIRDPSTGQITRWKADGTPDRMLPFVGIFESTAQSWGLDWNAMVGNKQAQIAGMAKILNGLSQKYGGYENAAHVYFGGEKALNGGFTDEFGMKSDTYGQTAINDWKMLDQKAGYTGGYGDGGVGTGIVQEALQFVGVPYVWGSLPSAGDNPWETGWDCSAFVNYLDDKYGRNELPAGSHYQWADTVNKGLVIQDPGQLQAGDLVFFDTGLRGGGGANMNNASHVGMYIGNGQFIQAANAGAGTIVSSLSDYINMYGFLGGRKMGWSGQGQISQPTQPKFTNILQKYLMAA